MSLNTSSRHKNLRIIKIQHIFGLLRDIIYRIKYACGLIFQINKSRMVSRLYSFWKLS